MSYIKALKAFWKGYAKGVAEQKSDDRTRKEYLRDRRDQAKFVVEVHSTEPAWPKLCACCLETATSVAPISKRLHLGGVTIHHSWGVPCCEACVRHTSTGLHRIVPEPPKPECSVPFTKYYAVKYLGFNYDGKEACPPFIFCFLNEEYGRLFCHSNAEKFEYVCGRCNKVTSEASLYCNQCGRMQPTR